MYMLPELTDMLNQMAQIKNVDGLRKQLCHDIVYPIRTVAYYDNLIAVFVIVTFSQGKDILLKCAAAADAAYEFLMDDLSANIAIYSPPFP